MSFLLRTARGCGPVEGSVARATVSIGVSWAPTSWGASLSTTSVERPLLCRWTLPAPVERPLSARVEVTLRGLGTTAMGAGGTVAAGQLGGDWSRCAAGGTSGWRCGTDRKAARAVRSRVDD